MFVYGNDETEAKTGTIEAKAIDNREGSNAGLGFGLHFRPQIR